MELTRLTSKAPTQTHAQTHTHSTDLRVQGAEDDDSPGDGRDGPPDGGRQARVVHHDEDHRARYTGCQVLQIYSHIVKHFRLQRGAQKRVVDGRSESYRMNGWMVDGGMDGRTYGRTDGWTYKRI